MKRFWHLLSHPEELSTPCAAVLMGGIYLLVALMYIWQI